MPTPVITQGPQSSRFEAHIGDDLAGFAAYELSPGLITFTHTEVDPKFEGRGVGSTLVRGALDQVRAEGNLKVRAVCPFVGEWIRRHPDYADLVSTG